MVELLCMIGFIVMTSLWIALTVDLTSPHTSREFLSMLTLLAVFSALMGFFVWMIVGDKL